MDENIIYIENLNQEKNKIKMYVEEETSKLLELSSLYSKINASLKIKNSEELENKQLELYQKINIMNKNHENNINVLVKNIQKYKETAFSAKVTLDNIKNG